MRSTIRGQLARLVVAASLVLATTATLAATALAKEGIQAELDAPIARETPGGTTLLLGMVVTMFDAEGTHLVSGSIEVSLIGADGTSRSGLARETTPGHYVIRLQVPASGVRDIQVAVPGASGPQIGFVGMPLVPGPITKSTAQVAPPIAAPAARASAPAPRVVSPVVDPAPVVPAPVAVGPASPAGPGAPTPLIAVVLAVVAATAVTGLLVRRARAGGALRVRDRAPGG